MGRFDLLNKVQYLAMELDELFEEAREHPLFVIGVILAIIIAFIILKTFLKAF